MWRVDVCVTDGLIDSWLTSVIHHSSFICLPVPACLPACLHVLAAGCCRRPLAGRLPAACLLPAWGLNACLPARGLNGLRGTFRHRQSSAPKLGRARARVLFRARRWRFCPAAAPQTLEQFPQAG